MDMVNIDFWAVSGGKNEEETSAPAGINTPYLPLFLPV
jgi:hypothetical protein